MRHFISNHTSGSKLSLLLMHRLQTFQALYSSIFSTFSVPTYICGTFHGAKKSNAEFEEFSWRFRLQMVDSETYLSSCYPPFVALNSLWCADVPLRNSSLTHSLTHSGQWQTLKINRQRTILAAVVKAFCLATLRDGMWMVWDSCCCIADLHSTMWPIPGSYVARGNNSPVRHRGGSN